MEPQGFADALGVGSERRREIKDGADMFAVGTCGYIVTTEMGKIEKGIDLGERSECGLEPLSFEFPWNSQWRLECGDWSVETGIATCVWSSEDCWGLESQICVLNIERALKL